MNHSLPVPKMRGLPANRNVLVLVYVETRATVVAGHLDRSLDLDVSARPPVKVLIVLRE